MSSLLDTVLQVNVYVQPVQFCLAIITNTINIRIFCTNALRSSSCTHYFLAYAIYSIIYICIACPTQFLRGFHLDWANTFAGCKVQFYFLYLTALLARLMLVAASFDRFCSSSNLHRLRLISKVRIARFTIIIITIISIIYMSPMLIIYDWDEISNTCLQHLNFLISIYVLSQILIYYISVPLLMIIFGLLTIASVQQQAARVGPQPVRQRHRRTERQLTRMLILQISIHLIFSIPLGVMHSMNAFNTSTTTPNIIAVRYIFVIWQQCDYFASFFLYVLSGSAYRKEFFRITKLEKYRSRILSQPIDSQLVPHLSTINNIVLPQIGM